MQAEEGAAAARPDPAESGSGYGAKNTPCAERSKKTCFRGSGRSVGGRHPMLRSDANIVDGKTAVNQNRIESPHATDLLAPPNQGEEVGGMPESHTT
jgi:hypothetical protein